MLNDYVKNGRHEKIDVAFLNQECRMGKKSKVILTMFTSLVIFPSSNVYQNSRLLKEHIGMSKTQVEKVLKLQSRWVMINRSVPQYVLYTGGAYLLNKDVY